MVKVYIKLTRCKDDEDNIPWNCFNKIFFYWIFDFMRRKFHIRMNTKNLYMYFYHLFVNDTMKQAKFRRLLKTLLCPQNLPRYLVSWPFWLVKSVKCSIVEGGNNYSQNQSKMPLYAKFVQQSKTVSWLILTVIASWISYMDVLADIIPKG